MALGLRGRVRHRIAFCGSPVQPFKGAAKVGACRKAETFAEIVYDWIERHAIPNKGARTVGDDRLMLRLHIIPQIGAMKAVEITKRDIIRRSSRQVVKAGAIIPHRSG